MFEPTVCDISGGQNEASKPVTLLHDALNGVPVVTSRSQGIFSANSHKDRQLPVADVHRLAQFVRTSETVRPSRRVPRTRNSADFFFHNVNRTLNGLCCCVHMFSTLNIPVEPADSPRRYLCRWHSVANRNFIIRNYKGIAKMPNVCTLLVPSKSYNNKNNNSGNMERKV